MDNLENEFIVKVEQKRKNITKLNNQMMVEVNAMKAAQGGAQ
jgi:hypothetical protein